MILAVITTILLMIVVPLLGIKVISWRFMVHKENFVEAKAFSAYMIQMMVSVFLLSLVLFVKYINWHRTRSILDLVSLNFLQHHSPNYWQTPSALLLVFLVITLLIIYFSVTLFVRYHHYYQYRKNRRLLLVAMPIGYIFFMTYYFMVVELFLKQTFLAS